MIKKLLTCCALLATAYAHAQTLSPQVLAADGAYSVSPNASLSWTLGEVVTETYTVTGNHLTQGFQQPEIIITGIEDPAPGISVSIYPNPSAGQVNIEFAEGAERNVVMQLTDANGKLVSQRSEVLNGPQTVSLDLTKLAAGQYFLSITEKSNNTRSTYTIQKNN